jgi:hypothetical protein
MEKPHPCVAARFRSGSDQEGRMKRIEVRRRMLGSRKIRVEPLRKLDRLR